MTPWPDEPAAVELSNRATIEALTGIPVAGLSQATPDTLATAGSALPLDAWLPPAA
jgi:hypothetical protein